MSDPPSHTNRSPPSGIQTIHPYTSTSHNTRTSFLFRCILTYLPSIKCGQMKNVVSACSTVTEEAQMGLFAPPLFLSLPTLMSKGLIASVGSPSVFLLFTETFSTIATPPRSTRHHGVCSGSDNAFVFVQLRLKPMLPSLPNLAS